MNSKRLRWKSDFDKEVVLENLLARGWTKADKEDEDWNVYWASREVRNMVSIRMAGGKQGIVVANNFSAPQLFLKR